MSEKLYTCPHCGKELNENSMFHGLCPFCHKIFEADNLLTPQTTSPVSAQPNNTFKIVIISLVCLAAFFYMLAHPMIIFLYLIIIPIAIGIAKASKHDDKMKEVRKMIYDFVDEVRKDGFPEMDIPSQLPLILSEGEKLRFAYQSAYCDYRSERTNFGGHSASLSIPTGIKGMRFRAGGFSGSASKSERVLKVLDSGFFIVTNQKIGFRGEEATFDIPLKKISGIKNEGDYLYFYITGRQTPEIIKCDPSSAIKSIVELSIKRSP
jgi:hypothetical protein